MIYRMLAIWSLVPLLFLNPTWTSGISWVMCCWSLDWWSLSITWLACSVQFSSVAQSCPTLCDSMNHSMPDLPVHHQLSKFTQNSYPSSQWCYPAISSSVVPFSSCPEYFQHQGLFQLVNSSHASILDECNCRVVRTFFGIGMKTDILQTCGHCWICWHIQCSM